MNRHRTRAARRHHHRRPHGRRCQSTLLRRGLCRARSFVDLHDRLRLVELAHHLGHLDAVEHDGLLALHERRLHDLARGGVRW